jgi:hypothetical protein
MAIHLDASVTMQDNSVNGIDQEDFHGIAFDDIGSGSQFVTNVIAGQAGKVDRQLLVGIIGTNQNPRRRELVGLSTAGPSHFLAGVRQKIPVSRNCEGITRL